MRSEQDTGTGTWVLSGPIDGTPSADGCAILLVRFPRPSVDCGVNPQHQVPSLQDRAVAHVTALADPAAPAVPVSARVTVHFHPDRLFKGVPLLDVMARDGVYRSQFETGTSNGGLTAFEGGDRWMWESRIFGGAYDNAEPHQRPRYGALNHLGQRTGGSPRFGSAHLRLRPETLARTTFCYPDSYHEPKDFGVAQRMGLASLLERDWARLDPLDRYIEAQVHGPILLGSDVEAIVLDPCYRDTDVGLAAARLGCPVEWHDGFRVHVDVLCRNPEYRGAEFVELGCSFAEDGWLTARMIGDAARSGKHDEQALKRVWHYVARFG